MDKELKSKEESKNSKTIAVIVAHPDDETLWAGGTILSHPTCNWFIVCLSRKNDAERADRFYKALQVLKAQGNMGDLDDGPEQNPLDPAHIENTILDLLPPVHYDLIITHNPNGEYTRHLRHEEVSKAVVRLWQASKIHTRELWTFAYEDGNKQYYPKPVGNANFCRILPERIWQKKYNLITKTYGFGNTSFEAEAAPHTEAFWQFTHPQHAEQWVINGGVMV